MGQVNRRLMGVAAGVAALVLVAVCARDVAAQVSAPSFSNSSSANESTGPSPNPSFQRFSDTQTLSTGSTGFQTRYFGNTSADCGPACGPKTETLDTNYTVSWTVTAAN